MTKSQTFLPIVLSQKHMKRISSHSSLSTLNDTDNAILQKNRKIPDSVKIDFIQMVTQKNFSMKNAAKLVGISYSTAKKIFTSFRQSLQIKTSTVTEVYAANLQRASFYEDKSLDVKKIKIFSLIGGSFQNL